MSTKAEAFWQAYQAARGPQPERYDVTTLGDGEALSAELVDLVLHGPKRATACLVRDFQTTGEPMPRVGGHTVVTDHLGEPRLIWRTTDLRVGPMLSVDDTFAWDEGEGDRSRDGWLAGHRRYFLRQAAREGFVFDEAVTPVLFERFRVVWPPAAADPDT